MALATLQVDRAIVALHRRDVRFTFEELRRELSVPAKGPDAKKVANRVYQLHRRSKVLRTDSSQKRNMTYALAPRKARGFERRVAATQTSMFAGPVDKAPVGRLARLPELESVKTTLQALSSRLQRVERLVLEMQTGLREAGRRLTRS